jgi:hypothetical protein
MSSMKKIANASNVVTGPDGTRKWYVDDQLHREDGPAVERADGTKQWYRDGKLHREDGPAIEWADGEKEWYLDGKKVAQEDVLRSAPSI